MKKTILLILIAFFMVVFVDQARGQTVPIGIEDLKELRRIAADREFQKNRADEAERQRDAFKGSAESWRQLYESEKNRADVVQGGRVDELQKAIADYKSEIGELKKANAFLHDQADRDREQIGQLNFDVRKLKSERKFWFAGGALIGAAAGGYVGYNARRFASTALTAVSGNRPAANAFRATFQF